MDLKEKDEEIKQQVADELKIKEKQRFNADLENFAMATSKQGAAAEK